MFKDWVESSFGHRYRFEDELDNAELTIESAIYKDRTLTNAGWALVAVALSTTVQFAKALVQHIDITHNQLTRSKCSITKAWSLITWLIIRIFQDIFDPQELNVFK